MNNSTTHEELLRAPTAAEIAFFHSWAHVALQRIVDAILQPTTFLAAVVWLLGGTYIDVAVIASATAMGNALGSVIMPFALANVSDIRLVLLGANLVRAVASAIIAVIGWQAENFSQSQVVTVLVTGLLFYQIASAANVSRNPRSFIANVDQPTSARSRQVVGAIAGLLGGLVAWRALGNRDFSFEEAAGLLLFLAGFASLGSVWFQISAPVRFSDTHQKLPVPSWNDVEQVLQNGQMQRYLWVRLLFGLATIADPFIIIYGLAQMRLSLWYLGAAMIAVVLGQIAGGALWTFFGEMSGSRKAIQVSAAMRFAGLTLAVSIPFFGSSRWYQEAFDSAAFASWIFVGVFFLISLAQNTYTRNELHYAMRQIGDGKLYPAADMVLNTMLVITALTPVIGAIVIRATSLRTMLAIAAGLAFIAVMSSAFLVGRRKPRRKYLAPELRGPRTLVAGRAERTGRVKIRRIKK